MIKKDYKDLNKHEKNQRLIEIAKVFFKLGVMAFGGPAAHIAMMEDEIIEKRKWISREKFMDLIGTTNLIPGPNSTEMAILIGIERAGILGLVLAGISFILPSMAITLVFAFIYVKYGSIPEVHNILNGIKPVIIAMILHALYRLSKSTIKSKAQIILAIFIGVIYLFGIGEISLLFIAGFIFTIFSNKDKISNKLRAIEPISLSLLFLTFFKIGAVLYGSGYVLLAFLETEFIEKLHILTMPQLIDAVAIGEFTPGPIFTTSTFIGYILNGLSGGLIATIGVFLPSFIVVLLIKPILPKLRSSPWASGMLDGINVGSLVLMTAVTIKLGISSLTNWMTITIFIASFYIQSKFKTNSALLVLGGLIGWFVGIYI
ncbi:chromate transporter [Schnuerera ultunensis]|uniref:Chromate transporter n=1 Tax=[Clostridium] ultunense Esp TaxID=1288971 RepID=A0A1M4PQ07_9FIRM|nr:chromate transporter [Schnuerera ultunensis]SHD77543.1 Chromate transporter [[Clostridium] ultunense Esp]